MTISNQQISNNENILTLNQKLSICLPSTQTNNTKSLSQKDKARLQVLLMDLAQLGFKLDKKLISILKTYNAQELKSAHSFLTKELSVLIGDHVKYIPLFLNFPESIPNDLDYLVRRFIGYFSNIFSEDLNQEGTRLSCGHHIDPDLFDVNSFGACPICQMQVKELSIEKGESHRTLAEKVDFKKISYISEQNQHEYISQLFNFPRPLSLKQRMHLFSYIEKSSLADVVVYFKEPIKVKENLALYIGKLIEFNQTLINNIDDLPETLVKCLNNPNDVLRVVAILSKGASSLTDNFRINLTNRHRRLVLQLLESVLVNKTSFDEGLKYRNLWVQVGRYLHIGAIKDKYPHSYKFFDFLRNDNRTHKTYSQKVHKAILKKDSMRMVELLKPKPGMFLRNLDTILRNAKNTSYSENLIKNLLTSDKLLKKANTAMITKLAMHFAHRSNSKSLRLFLPKSENAKFYVSDQDNRKEIPDEVCDLVFETLVNELLSRFGKNPQFNKGDKIFIDPRLKGLLVPLNIQTSTKELSTLQRGSKIPLKLNSEVLRLFVYWKQNNDRRVDVDLSVMAFNDNLTESMHVSFQSLSDNDQSVVHSGDIQSAPEGASEFIDIKHKKLLAKGMRYVGVMVNSFTGQTFDTFQCFSGMMERKNIKDGKLFDPSTVTHKYDVCTKTTAVIPFILDLKTGELLWTDIGGERSQFLTILSSKGKIAKVIRATQIMDKSNMSINDLLTIHVRAAGAEVVSDEKEANQVMKFEDCLNPVTFVSKYVK